MICSAYAVDCDVQFILGAGTHLDGNTCPSSGAGGFAPCFAAFLGIHLTSQSTAYLEVKLWFVNVNTLILFRLSGIGNLGMVGRS